MNSPTKNCTVFVINLARSSDRRNVITQNLREIGLQFELWCATSAESSPLSTLTDYSPEKSVLVTGRMLNDGEIGCALSHLAIYNEMVKRGIERAVILEDDVFLSKDFPTVLSDILVTHFDVDILNFITDSREYGTGNYLANGQEITRTWHANRTAAYLISKRAAKRLLEVGFPVCSPADGLLGSFDRHQIEIFGIYPSPASLRPLPSTIGSGMSVRHLRLKRKRRSLRFWWGRSYVLKWETTHFVYHAIVRKINGFATYFNSLRT